MENNTNNVSISGIHIELTDSLKAIVNSKSQKLLNHNSKIIGIHIKLEYDANKSKNEEFIAHGEIDINGRNLVAHAATDDLYKSIDLMINKLDRQLTEKTKFVKNHDKSAVYAGTASTVLES